MPEPQWRWRIRWMPEHDPDELDLEADESAEELCVDPHIWLSQVRVEVPEELSGVPFS